MRLVFTTPISPNGPITRQTLYDMWASTASGEVQIGDLAVGTLQLSNVENLSEATNSPGPGQIVYDKSERLWYLWIDELDYTGVSCWVSIGPDVIEDIFLSTEPIPPAAFISLDEAGQGRMVRLSSGVVDRRAIGANPLQQTVASGTWFSVRTQGFMWTWHVADALTGASDAQPGGPLKSARGIDPHIPGALVTITSGEKLVIGASAVGSLGSSGSNVSERTGWEAMCFDGLNRYQYCYRTTNRIANNSTN